MRCEYMLDGTLGDLSPLGVLFCTIYNLPAPAYLPRLVAIKTGSKVFGVLNVIDLAGSERSIVMHA